MSFYYLQNILLTIQLALKISMYTEVLYGLLPTEDFWKGVISYFIKNYVFVSKVESRNEKLHLKIVTNVRKKFPTESIGYSLSRIYHIGIPSSKNEIKSAACMVVWGSLK